ncbi:MAG: hypothetical protein OEY61_11290 [Gammaproteobacteria bacterium]|nr:hypothetical protein [Gammaproteobacteria bacterium]
MLHHLHQLIGIEVSVNDSRCQLIEVLEEGPALVFMCIDHSTAIQSDQHGGAHRRVQKTYTIPCLNESQEDLHPVAKQILPADIHVDFLEFLIRV